MTTITYALSRPEASLSHLPFEGHYRVSVKTSFAKGSTASCPLLNAMLEDIGLLFQPPIRPEAQGVLAGATPPSKLP